MFFLVRFQHTWDCTCPCASGDDGMFVRHFFRHVIFRIQNFERGCVFKACVAINNRDFVFLHQETNTAREFGCNIPTALDDFFEVNFYIAFYI